jgi:hypothetical protein
MRPLGRKVELLNVALSALAWPRNRRQPTRDELCV